MTKKKIAITIIIILLVIISAVGVLYFKDQKNNNKQSAVVKTVDKIEGYDYSIKENDSKVKRDLFKELKDILDEDPIDYEAYAAKLSEIFVVDVYDLNTKVNKYDVGGLEYVLPEHQEKFKLKLQDTLYNNVQDNLDNDRKQKLPVVSKVSASGVTEESYELNGSNYEAYSVKVSIDYKQDLGYDNTVSIKLIKKDSKLYVVLVEPI